MSLAAAPGAACAAGSCRAVLLRDGDAEAAERFHRLWRYDLLWSAGFFRSRQDQLRQLVLTPAGARQAAADRSIRPGGCPLAASATGSRRP